MAREEERLGRHRALTMPPPLSTATHRRQNLLLFLTATEQAALSSVRIDAADANARFVFTSQHLATAFDCSFNQFRGNSLDCVNQPDMSRYMNHFQPRTDQHERHLRRMRQLSKNLRMPREIVTTHP